MEYLASYGVFAIYSVNEPVIYCIYVEIIYGKRGPGGEIALRVTHIRVGGDIELIVKRILANTPLEHRALGIEDILLEPMLICIGGGVIVTLIPAGYSLVCKSKG